MVTRPEPLIYRPIHTVDELATHLRWAMAVELSTVPPYLTALYSVVEPASPAAVLMRSVVIEEMLHMMLVGNLLNSVGTLPSLDADVVPAYPGFMPHHAAGGPFIQLQPLSAELAETVFMAIELPEASPRVPAEGDQFRTIGQFYKAIEEGFERCVAELGERAVFGHDTDCQHADVYPGVGAGRLLTVHDLTSAKQAIVEITQQGEGARRRHPHEPGDERFGGRDFYGLRPDGAFGPIVGTPWELSHYRKFQQLATGEVPIPAVFPMAPNPTADAMQGSARGLSLLFDAVYTLLLGTLEDVLRTPDAGRFFGLAFPLMQECLPHLARLLMRTPVQAQADPQLGPTAGPAFRWRLVPLADVIAEAEQLRSDPPDLGAAYVARWHGALGGTVSALRRASSLIAMAQ